VLVEAAKGFFKTGTFVTVVRSFFYNKKIFFLIKNLYFKLHCLKDFCF
jgi:hypothetical protein